MNEEEQLRKEIAAFLRARSEEAIAEAFYGVFNPKDDLNVVDAEYRRLDLPMLPEGATDA